MQEEGVMTVAKHLPRHRSDERALPDSMVVLNLNRIDAQTLEPLQQLIAERSPASRPTTFTFLSKTRKALYPVPFLRYSFRKC